MSKEVSKDVEQVPQGPAAHPQPFQTKRADKGWLSTYLSGPAAAAAAASRAAPQLLGLLSPSRPVAVTLVPIATGPSLWQGAYTEGCRPSSAMATAGWQASLSH